VPIKKAKLGLAFRQFLNDFNQATARLAEPHSMGGG
jgi:hypothetical protein